jgi:hypothetical protein
MSEKLQLKGGISELNFGYNAKMEGYTNSSSDITKLAEMVYVHTKGGMINAS